MTQDSTILVKGSDTILFRRQMLAVRQAFPGTRLVILVNPGLKDAFHHKEADELLTVGYDPAEPVSLVSILKSNGALTRLKKRGSRVVISYDSALGEGYCQLELLARHLSAHDAWAVNSRGRLLRLSGKSWLKLLVRRTLGRGLLNCALIALLPVVWLVALIAWVTRPGDLDLRRIK